MSQYNGRMDGPPPAEVVERFSPAIAEAVRAYAAKPNDEAGRAVLAAFAEDGCHASVEGVIGERRARIGALLSDLDREFCGLSEDLGYRQWQSGPTSAYRRVPLGITRRNPKQGTNGPAHIIADLAEIAWSAGGTVNGDAPRQVIRQEDLGRRPSRRVPTYEIGAPGSESIDRRVVGGVR